MTEQEKDILIGKMIDAPGFLSDEELNAIMLDDELRDILEVSSMLKGAYAFQSEIDVEREWRLFRHRILSKTFWWRLILKVAAVFIGVVMVSGIMVKVADLMLMPKDQPVVAVTVRSSGGEFIKADDAASPEAVDGDHAPSEPVDKLPDGKVREKKPVAEYVEGDEEFDIDEYLRQQQAEIDRDIALINAEIYLDQRDAIQEFMEYIDGNADIADYADAEIIME